MVFIPKRLTVVKDGGELPRNTSRALAGSQSPLARIGHMVLPNLKGGWEMEASVPRRRGKWVW